MAAALAGSLATVVPAFVVALVAALSVIDVRERRVPNAIVVPAAAFVLGLRVALEPERAAEWSLAALGAAAFLLALHVVSPKGIGMGDVKLAFVLGAALGHDVVLALAVAWFVAGAYSVYLLARRGAAARRATFPFVPALAIGATVALLVA